MTTEEKTFNLLESTGLNWSVTKQPLFTKLGLETKSHGIFRGADWIGTVGERYTPLQNSELAMTIVKASEGVGVDVTKGGELGGGRKVYLQAELPEAFVGRGNVKRYITALNSHDGSTSIGFGSSNTVIYCQNTFHRAYKGLNHFKHTFNAQARIDVAIKDLRLALNLDQQLITNYKRMAELPLKDEAIERVIRKIFKIELSDKPEDATERQKQKVEQFGRAVQKSIEEQGNTIWALFNGVTRYTNHVLPEYLREYRRNSETNGENIRNESLMSGRGYEISNMGFDEIMAYVEENSHELILR